MTVPAQLTSPAIATTSKPETQEDSQAKNPAQYTSVNCKCGARLRIKRVHAGQTGKCPKCGNLVVPSATKQDSVSDQGLDNWFDVPLPNAASVTRTVPTKPSLSTNHSLIRSPIWSSTAGAVIHGLLYFFVVSNFWIAVVAPFQKRIDDMQLTLPHLANSTLSIWQFVTDHSLLSFLSLCVLILADGSVLYALGCTERWPVAREVWSGMILAMLVGFVTFSAFALLYPFQLMLSPIIYEEAQREEFERLRGEWTLVSSEQAGSTISVQPSNADILRFEQTIEIRKESQAGKKSKSKRDDLPRVGRKDQEVRRNNFSWKMPGNVVEGSFNFTIDRLPKQIQFSAGASVQLPGFGQKSSQIAAIYKLERDRLTLCLFPPNDKGYSSLYDSEQSMEFNTKDTKNKVMIFQRRSNPLQR